MSDNNGFMLHWKLSLLFKISPSLWATAQFAIAQVEYLGLLRHMADRSELRAHLLLFVRKCLLIADAIHVLPPARHSGILRDASFLLRSQFLNTMVTNITLFATLKADIYGDLISRKDLKRLVNYGETALRYYEDRLEGIRFWGERSRMRVHLHSLQQRADLHSLLAFSYVNLVPDDPARYTELALSNLAMATSCFEEMGDAQAVWSLIGVQQQLGDAILKCPNLTAERSALKRCVEVLSKAREALLPYLQIMEEVPDFVSDEEEWKSLPAITRMKYSARYAVHLAQFQRRIRKDGSPDPVGLGITLPRRIAFLDWRLGIAYRKLGDLNKAIEHLTLALANRWDEDSAAAILVDRGTSYLELGANQGDTLKRAGEDFWNVLDSRKKFESFKTLALAIIGMAQVYLLRIGDGDKSVVDRFAKQCDWSEHQLRLLMKLARAHCMIQICRDASILLGRMYALRQKYKRSYQALALASRLTDRTRRLAVTPRLKNYWAETGTPLYDQLVQAAYRYHQHEKEGRMLPTVANKRVALRSALTFAERGRVVLLQEELCNRYLLPSGALRGDPDLATLFDLRRAWHQAELRRSEEETSPEAGLNASRADETRRQRNELESLYFSALEDTRQRFDDPGYDPDHPVMPVTFARVESAIETLSIEQDTALVEYHVTDKKVFVFVLFPRRDPYPFTFFLRASKVSLQEVQSVSDQWYTGFSEGRSATTSVGHSRQKRNWVHWGRGYLPQILLRLKDLALVPYEIIKNWESSTGRVVARVIVAPHRFLHLVPFHALEIPSGKMWGDTATIQYVPSSSVLCRLLTNRARKPLSAVPESSSRNVVAIAWSPADRNLPSAGREAHFVANALGGEVLEGPGTTPGRVTEAIRDADYIHFACHAVHDDSDPLTGGLILAPEDGTQRLGEGRLTLGDIFESVNLARSPVVVLSACETGVTKLGRINDDYIGMPAGFLYAGARMVVGTLWPVNDLATLLLFRKMTMEVSSGNSPTDSLQRAQQWLRGLSADAAAEAILEATHSDRGSPQDTAIEEYCFSLRQLAKLEPFPFASPYWWAGVVVNGID
jgi:CHAT domain-containing protein/tetratricopeptide (TPR) repeat protein